MISQSGRVYNRHDRLAKELLTCFCCAVPTFILTINVDTYKIKVYKIRIRSLWLFHNYDLWSSEEKHFSGWEDEAPLTSSRPRIKTQFPQFFSSSNGILNGLTTCLLRMSSFPVPLSSVSTRKSLDAGRQEVKREKARRRWKIVLEFMVVVVALAVAARVLFTLLLEPCTLERVPKNLF